MEHRFTLITLRNVDQMVGVVEVDLSVEVTLTGGTEEVVNERERVAIFFHNFVKIVEVNAQAQ